ncbi:hypothetical protein C0416_03775 [bacterium]|nr:hypothetical protein [bacterium]
MKLLNEMFMKRIFIVGALILWAFVIILKQGGQSLLIHYAWPFIVGGTFILLFNKEWLKNKPGITELLMLLTLSTFLITFLFDLSPSDGSLELMNISGGLLLAITLHQTKWTEEDLKTLFIGLIAVVVVLNMWGLILYAGGHPFNRLVGPLIKPNEAFAGFPNLLANLNILAIIPAVYLHNKTTNKKYTAIMCVTCLILFTGFLLTFSRAAWISVIFGIAIVAFTTFKFNKQLLKLVLAFVISLILVTGINSLRGNSQQVQSLEEKIAFQSEDEGSSITERVASIQRGLDMTLSHPLTGVGAGSFNYISQSYEKDFETLSSYPYSLPVKMLAEHGVIVFTLLLFWLGIIIVSSLKNKSQLVVVGGVTVLSLLVHHSVDNNLDFFAASFPLFILLGIIWPHNEGKKNHAIHNKYILTVIAIATLAGIAFAGHEAWYGRYYIQARNSAGAGNHQEAFENYGKAQDLFFSRDASLAQSYSALEIYRENKESIWLENSFKKAGEYSKLHNPIDYQGPLQLAAISCEQNNYSDCNMYATQAELLGGGNNFKTDFYKLTYLYSKGDSGQSNNFIDLLNLKLNKYFDLLKVNAHMTILTDNPRYAIYILEELSKHDYDRFQPLYESMFEAAKDEYKKFHTKYGIKAEIDFLE